MKKRSAVLAVLLSLPMIVLAVPEGKAEGGWHHGPNIERLTKELQLSDEQKTQLQAIFKEQRAKHKALREEGKARMKEILNAEQLSKLDEMRERRHERWKQRRHCFEEQEGQP
ncbi:MAG: Spy/CpxP family protein refolding chaperone [Gammaproteobacteria bacterium]